MRYIMAALLVLMSGSVSAHSWTPTYPKLEPAYVDGVLTTRMLLFNVRTDVEYFEISVWDADWNPVRFATSERIVRVAHLERKNIDIYIREQDRRKAVYVCSKSKLLRDSSSATLISSRICSKIK